MPVDKMNSRLRVFSHSLSISGIKRKVHWKGMCWLGRQHDLIDSTARLRGKARDHLSMDMALLAGVKTAVFVPGRRAPRAGDKQTDGLSNVVRIGPKSTME